MRLSRRATIASLLLAAAHPVVAQQPTDTHAAPVAVWNWLASAGTMSFAGGSSRGAVGTAIEAELWKFLDLGASPTYAWASDPASVVGRTRIPGASASGIGDLPLWIGVSHDLPGGWGGSSSLSFGVIAPTGDSLSVGSGHTSTGLDWTFDYEASDAFTLSLAASHSLSHAYPVNLASNARTGASIGGTFTIGAVDLDLTYATDLGAHIDTTLSTSSSLVAGVGVPLSSALSMFVSGAHGLSSAAPRWMLTAGLGTSSDDLLGLADAGPVVALRRALGIGGGGRAGTGCTALQHRRRLC